MRRMPRNENSLLEPAHLALSFIEAIQSAQKHIKASNEPARGPGERKNNINKNNGNILC